MRVKQTARKSTCHARPQGRADPIASRIGTILSTKRHSSSPALSSTASPSNPGTSKAGATTPGKGSKNLSMLKQQHASVKQKPRAKSGVRALQEIRRLQRTADLQIPRAPFQRLVREVAQNIEREKGSKEPLRFQTAALMALQEAAESYLVGIFEQSYWCTHHAKRVTLYVSDMHLVQRIRKAVEISSK